MPHLYELPSEWQAVLNRDVVPFIKTEIVIDPDGYNIDLTDYIGEDTSIVIQKQKAIFPYGNIGRFTMQEMRIKLLNINDFFNYNNINSPFYYTSTRLRSERPATQNFAEIIKGEASRFSVGQKIVFDNGDEQQTATISSIDTSNSDYDILNLTNLSSASGTFPAGSLVEIDSLVGKIVVIRSSAAGLSTKIDQYKGILAWHPRLFENYAELIIHDLFKSILEINLKANDYRYLTDSQGSTQSSLEYERANDPPSSGQIDLSKIWIDPERCKIGQWEFEFLSNVDFKVTDPGGTVYYGDINNDFYAGESTSIKQLYIPYSAWSGTFDIGDKLRFKTVCNIGQPTNSFDTIPKMLKALLTENWGANLDPSEIDTTAFDNFINQLAIYKGAISFTQKINVLKAIEYLQTHINAVIFLKNDGTFSIDIYWPEQSPGGNYALSPDADVMEVQQEDLGRVRAIGAQYNYDYANSKFQDTLMEPQYYDFFNPDLQINFPAYHNTDRAQARAAISRIFRTWGRGVRSYEIEEKFNFGIAFDLNEIYDISSQHPEFSGKTVKIYEIRKDLIKQQVSFKAADMEFLISGYAYTNVDKTNSGKVTW